MVTLICHFRSKLVFNLIGNALLDDTLQKVLVTRFLRTILHYFLGNINEKVKREDLYLTKILLTAARKAITRLWLKPETPTFLHWTNIIQNVYIKEKFTFAIRLKLQIFI